MLPSKNVVAVKTGDKNTKGNKVVALYNGEKWDAEICAVNGTSYCIAIILC